MRNASKKTTAKAGKKMGIKVTTVNNPQTVETVRYGDVIVNYDIRYRSLDEHTVERYFEVLRTGGTLPPIEIMEKDGKPVLISGLHRMTAYYKYATTSKEFGGLGLVKKEELSGIEIPFTSYGQWDEQRAYTLALLSDMKSGLPPTKEQRNERIRTLFIKFGGEGTPADIRLTQAKLSEMFHVHQSNISRIVSPEPDATKKDKAKKKAEKKKAAKSETVDTRDAKQTTAKDESGKTDGKAELPDTSPKAVFGAWCRISSMITAKHNREKVLDHLKKYAGDNQNLSLCLHELGLLAVQSKAVRCANFGDVTRENGNNPRAKGTNPRAKVKQATATK